MTEDIRDILKAMNDYNLISIYGVWLEELKARGMIRTNNVIGELGEYLAIKYYKETLNYLNFKLHQQEPRILTQ